MATGISPVNNKPDQEYDRIIKDNDLCKDKKRLLKATQFRKRMREHCKGLNNDLDHSDDDIMIIELDGSPISRKEKKGNFEKEIKNSNNYEDKTIDDEILARQLQEEFDQEYATSLEFNIDNILDVTKHHQDINSYQSQSNNVNNPVNNSNSQTLNFNLNLSQRNLDNYGVSNELSIFQNNNFMEQFLAEENQREIVRPRINLINNHSRTTRRNLNSIPNSTIPNDRDFTSDDYDFLIELEKNSVKICLSKEELNMLPSFSFKQSMNDDNENDCSICFDPFKKDQMITSLACLHKFHSKCIKKWLKEKRKCPICQKDAINGN